MIDINIGRSSSKVANTYELLTIQLLTNFVTLEGDNTNKKKIIDFILFNKLGDVLVDSVGEIYNYFPKDIKIYLDYISNEEEDGQPQLEVKIESESEPYLLDYLDKFTYNYWLYKLNDINLIGKIVFMV